MTLNRKSASRKTDYLTARIGTHLAAGTWPGTSARALVTGRRRSNDRSTRSGAEQCSLRMPTTSYVPKQSLRMDGADIPGRCYRGPVLANIAA